MGTEEVELEGWDYIVKFKERLDIAVGCVFDGRDINESDYSVFQELHRAQREGRLQFFKTISTEDCTSVTQMGLFSENTSYT